MIETLLLTDLVADLPQAVRLQRLVTTLRGHFRCGAVALLRLEEEHLRPVAVDGLVREALGRRFAVGQHPRLAAILSRREVTCFDRDSTLPDPYDGLLDTLVGEPLPVHDCMGASLYVEGRLWGALTLDALKTGTFDEAAQAELLRCSVLVEAAIRVSRLEEEIHALRLSRAPGGTVRPGSPQEQGEELEIIGQSETLLRLLHELEVVADSELPVLLLGETGVGKELFARLLHRRSRRRNKPLVHVNCAALPESLAESELFGHVRGAFSGASADRPGRFEAADGGTLFLDEVGELPLPIQAKLLRALQNGEIQRLGADRPRRVNVRVIAATNRQLRESVRDGGFRADLYHRLSVYPVPIPPLRERGNDVLLLAGRFLELNRARLGLRSLRLAPEAEDALLRYPWPGNVRELEHVVSRAALKAVSRGADRADIVTLPPELLDLDGVSRGSSGGLAGPAAGRWGSSGEPADGGGTVGSSGTAAGGDGGGPQEDLPLRDAVDALQRQRIRAALQACEGNWAQAARRLGLDASNLHKLAHRLRLK
ncbi:nitric oxide reductase transcriptional regulator NorR [Quisquiliibacterium transsilvanicum]|uniref:Anaerobic nitric oxide reductase transcription regulator n=1 Tax=Quisquiliibacterium transsilvanicum TaxID=1549638 RepID=A0A7W8M9A7_9BURK|nr:nitric oxide reductase transcriptional regulator NorR [Quisquiliibacterium transsilvanicum]MBB5272683.1 anaerobic nitric oxide reductase transcription regulator [Quisquiliibacterium transsilvanicum]